MDELWEFKLPPVDPTWMEDGRLDRRATSP